VPTTQPGHDRRRWQFSLRELLVGTAVVAAVLGFGSWQGPLGAAGVLAVAGLCLLGMAVFSRRRRLAVFSGICLLLAAAGAGLFFFGPRSEICWVCPMCGKRMIIPEFCGVTLSERECETELSRWYYHAGLRPHQHRWVDLYAWGQYWGGRREGYAFGGRELVAELCLLRTAWDQVDRAAFNDLAKDYYATWDDVPKIREYRKKCKRLGVTLADP